LHYTSTESIVIFRFASLRIGLAKRSFIY